VEGCDSSDSISVVKSVLAKNGKRMERLGSRNLTGHYVEDKEDTEVGFDIPAVLVKGDGEIVEVV